MSQNRTLRYCREQPRQNRPVIDNCWQSIVIQLPNCGWKDWCGSRINCTVSIWKQWHYCRQQLKVKKMTVNEDRIGYKICIIENVMALGHWRRNFRLKPGIKSHWIIFKLIGGNWKLRTGVDRVKRSPDWTADEQMSTDEKVVTIASPVNQQMRRA